MIRLVSLSLLAVLLVGCNSMGEPAEEHKPDDSLADIEPYTEPTLPKRSDYVQRSTSEDYHVGMLRYRQSLINYHYRLTEYINQLGVTEGLLTSTGHTCSFPYTWQPIVMPNTPEPITQDPMLVNQILAIHVRELRRLINAANERYAPCVK